MSQAKQLDSDNQITVSAIDRIVLPVEQADGGRFRMARPIDLEGINRVISSAMDAWRISERVKRISLPLYQYGLDDLDFFQIFVVENAKGQLLAVAALEQVDSSGDQDGAEPVNLHGIYVDPVVHGTGLGSDLLEKVGRVAAMQGYRTMIVKAKADSTGFFIKQGFEKLPVRDPNRDYPYRYRKSLDLQLTV